MNLAAEETAIATLPEAQHVTFELCDMKPSGFIMDGPSVDDFEGLDMTPVISSPSYRSIRRVSRYKKLVPAENGKPATFRWGKLRYIAGSDILDMDEQNRLGITPNYLADIILFRNGHLSATNEGDTALFEYLHRCEYFTGAKDRPADAEDIFKALDPIGESMEEESVFDLQSQCLAILSALKSDNGKKGFHYNENALEFYCTLFKIPKFDGGYQSEAWVALARFAQDEPKRFLNSIANARVIFEEDVLQAMNFAVITVTTSKAFFTDGNQVILSYDRDLNDSERLSAIVDFMTNPKNNNQYENLRVRLRKAKDAKTSIQK